MLISKSMQSIIRVILSERVKSVRELAKESGNSLGITSKIVNQLIASGYLEKRNLKLKNKEKLLEFYSSSFSLKELESIYFIASERPAYIIKKIANIADKNKLIYAFTLFSATEIIRPYVSPNETHLYILKRQMKEWESVLPKNNILPAQKGNIILFAVDEHYFYNYKRINGINIISLPQLYADLKSYRGRGEEAAKMLGDLNV